MEALDTVAVDITMLEQCKRYNPTPPKAVGMPAQDAIEQDVAVLRDENASTDMQQAALTKADWHYYHVHRTMSTQDCQDCTDQSSLGVEKQYTLVA